MKLRRTSSPSGTVYWPADHPPIGGVVCLHGSEGALAGWNDVTCAMLAANGFVALAHRYNRVGDYPEHLNIDDVPLEGTVGALEWLREATAEWACRIGLFGASRGAEKALLLAQLLCARRPSRPTGRRRCPFPAGCSLAGLYLFRFSYRESLGGRLDAPRLVLEGCA